MANRRGPQAPHARLPAQRPLPSDDRVVVKRGERQPLRPSPASARGLHGRERLACAQRIEAEVPCSASHPAGMPPRSTEADPLRVQGDPMRPLRERCPKRRVAGVRCSRERERDSSQEAECEQGDPSAGVTASAAGECRHPTRPRERRASADRASRRSSGCRLARRPGCCRPGRRRLGRRPAREPPLDQPG
jgi:hypothetical protein